MSLIKSSATIGGYTLLSRVLGFLRDVTIASSLGASFLSDAFFVAFKLPNFLRRLFAEGAFNAAFVPLYAGSVASDGQEKATRFASEAMSLLLVILFVVTGIFILFMPWLMFILAPGFADDPTKFSLTVDLTRITMPYIIFISLVSLLGGILNSSSKFAAVAATPILMNLCLIIVPSLVDRWTPTGAHALAIAVFVAGVVQWIWLVYFCTKQGLLPRLVRPKMTPEVKKLLLLIGPAALGAGVAQINLFIDLIIASQFDSGVSYLYYADRINELPLAVIGIAVGTALLPLLSKQIRVGDMEAAFRTQNKAIGFTLFMSLPSAVAIMLIAEPIIRVMFERGAFGPQDTLLTAPALMAFAAGLPAFILIKILAPCFYANQDTKTPFKIASFCIMVNLLCNLALMWEFKHVGMAMATSISGWVNVALMLIALKRRGWIRLELVLRRNIIKTLIACVAMAFVLVLGETQLSSWLTGLQWQRFISLIGLSLIGALAYFSVSYILDTLQIRSRASR
jgi:putative peptidoglycan lipid II flippase